MQRILAVACVTLAASVAGLAAGGAETPGTSAPSAAGTGAPVPYPEGFRTWAHVKTGLVTAANPSYAVAGGFHHIYANAPALAGYGSGTFADGSVIVFDRLALQESAGNVKEGQRVVVDVMVRDAAAYAATGGWGFEEFAGSSRTERKVGSNAKTACFNCHAKQAPGAFVVSKLRD